MADYTLVIKAVDQTGSTLRNIEGGLSGLSGAAGLATRALGLAAVAAAAVGTAVAAIAVSSVKSASEIQSLAIQLKALTGSSEAGAAALNVIREAALKLPFDLQAIAAASPALVTVSKDSNDLARNIQLAADLAATTGLSFQDTASQLQRAFSAGAGAADLFREKGVLALAGFRAGATYSVDETIKKFRELGAKIAGTSEELNATLPGAISQLKDQYFKLQVAFGTPIGQALAAGLNALVGDLNKSSDSMQNAAKAAGQDFALGIATAIDAVARYIDYVSGIIRIFQPTIDIIIMAAKVIGDILVRALALAGIAFAQFGSALGVITDAIGLTDGLTAASDKLVQAYATLAKGGIASFGDASKQALDATTNGTTKAQDAVGRYTDAIRKSIAEQRNATDVTDKFGNTAFSNYQKAQTAAEIYLDKLKKSVQEAKNNLAILLTAFVKTADFATRIKFAAEIDNLRKSLGQASPVILTYAESLKKFESELISTASAQQRAADIAQDYANQYQLGTKTVDEYRAAAAGVNSALKTDIQLRSDAGVLLDDEARALSANKILLEEVTLRYKEGAVTAEAYAAAIGKIPTELRTFDQALTLNEAQFTISQFALNNQIDVLNALRKEYADGGIDLYEYTQRTRDLGDAIADQGRSIADVLGEATKQNKEYRDNISLQSQLNAKYKEGAISADIYSQAAKNLGIPDDQIQRSINAFGTVEDKARQFKDNFSKYSEEAGTAFSDSFVTAIMKGENALNSFKDFFKNILNYIAQQILKSAIADPLANALSGLAKNIGGSIFGSVGGATGTAASGSLFGSIGDTIGKFFGGFFADGGSIPGGKASIVGERGPELFIPGSSGTIVPNDALGGGGDTFHVNFNISAIDTQSGAEFIMRNKPIITGVIEQAYNKRGRRGPMG